MKCKTTNNDLIYCKNAKRYFIYLQNFEFPDNLSDVTVASEIYNKLLERSSSAFTDTFFAQMFQKAGPFYMDTNKIVSISNGLSFWNKL